MRRRRGCSYHVPPQRVVNVEAVGEVVEVQRRQRGRRHPPAPPGLVQAQCLPPGRLVAQVVYLADLERAPGKSIFQ